MSRTLNVRAVAAMVSADRATQGEAHTLVFAAPALLAEITKKFGAQDRQGVA
jgi:hypothetical protein